MTEDTYNLMERLRPGAKVRVFYGEGNINNELRHIRAVVDDGWIVYKVWWKHHRRWHYAVADIYDFHLGFKYGGMTLE